MNGHHFEKAENKMRIELTKLRMFDIRENQLAEILEIERVNSEEWRPL